jgi:Ca-activated chloride channel family protein
MTVSNPAAFFLLFASLLVILLHFLRARERRRAVSALFLWEGLPGDPQSRAARIRQQLDPLIVLQLAILLALVTALAQPGWRMRTTTLAGLAIVLDGSASMRALTDDGTTRYERAVGEARSLLDRYASTATALIQLSGRPAILARPDSERIDRQNALLRSEPTWYADGTADALHALLGSVGGTSQFERVVVLSDHPYPDLPTAFETILVDTGDNLALTAFSVRDNPDGEGVSALVSVLNDSDAYRDVTIRIDDRENQTTLAVLMEPDSADTFVIPFPSSRGTLFTASIEPEDDFLADNRRFFSLDRPIDARVHWLGSENRYLLAALQSVAPVTLVDSADDADLIVVHAARAPASSTGTILLVHAGIDDLLIQGETRPTDRIEIASPGHALLRDVDPSSFRIREAPTASLPRSAQIVLESGDVPLLVTYEDERRAVVYLAPDILDTNLPITVDFPLLIRNVVAGLVRLPSEISHRSAEVGEPVSLAGRGVVQALYDAEQRPIRLSDGLTTFRSTSPGFHTLVTDRGAFAIAVNVSPEESAFVAPAGEVGSTAVAPRDAVRDLPLWPVAAALAILLLLAEARLHASRRRLMRRTP